MARTKTIKVSEIMEICNGIIESKDWEQSQEAKRAACVILETVLLKTGNYGGFRHINLVQVSEKRYETEPETEYNRRYFTKREA